MKKFLALTIISLAVVGLVACGNTLKAETPENKYSQTPNTEENTITDNEPDETTAPVEGEAWGVTDDFGVDVGGLTERYYINCPVYTCFLTGHGKLGDQGDETMVVLGGQNDYTPEISDISELLPAYIENVKTVLFAVYGGWSENFVLTVENDEAVTVGEYKMHKFTGTMELDVLDDHHKLPFVAYATTLKSNGGYAYFMVYDKTADQSMGDAIEEYADNMAKTFREQR